MRFLSQYLKFVLKELNVNLLFLNGSLVHYFDGESLLTILMHAEFDGAECALTQSLTE